NDLSTFMRLLGLAFSQSQGHLRKYLGEVYGKVFKRYMTLVLRSAPELPVDVLFWRVPFMLGSAAFTLSSMKALKAMGEAEYGDRARTDEILRQMVPFLAAGMRAELVNAAARAPAGSGWRPGLASRAAIRYRVGFPADLRMSLDLIHIPIEHQCLTGYAGGQ